MTDWTKRRRLEAVIAGEKPDRTPVALWRHWPGDDQRGESLAAAHLKWQQDYDWDIVKVGPASTYSVVDWGVEDRWVGHIEGTREYTYHPIHQPSDWETVKPLSPDSGMLAEQIKALKLIGARLDDGTPFIPTVFSPLAMVRSLAGKEALATHMRNHPDIFQNALKVLTETTIRFIEAAKQTGISGIYYAIQHARYPLLSRDEYNTFGRPFDLQILESMQDLWCNMLHVHSTDIMFDLVADYPVQFINWHDRETELSLKQGLTQIKCAASGGVDQWTLHQDSHDATIKEAKDAMEQTNGRRLLLGTGCVAMVTTPLQNIRALREIVE